MTHTILRFVEGGGQKSLHTCTAVEAARGSELVWLRQWDKLLMKLLHMPIRTESGLEKLRKQ